VYGTVVAPVLTPVDTGAVATPPGGRYEKPPVEVVDEPVDEPVVDEPAVDEPAVDEPVDEPVEVDEPAAGAGVVVAGTVVVVVVVPVVRPPCADHWPYGMGFDGEEPTPPATYAEYRPDEPTAPVYRGVVAAPVYRPVP